MPLLKFDDLNITPTPAQRDLHDRLLTYRHKVVAHSDVEQMRILVSAIKPFDDMAAIMPIVTTDEGLQFLADRTEWERWLHVLTAARAKVIFAAVQAVGAEFRLHKDYMYPDADK
jgi:hypothetical protein